MDGIMRYSYIVALIVLGTGAATNQPLAWAQPYQKNWHSFPGHASGSAQKHLGFPPDAAYQPPCQPPCQQHFPPCEPDQPRDAVPDQPRDAVPGIAPGVFAAPPQSGIVEGPSQGFELGNVAITLPELTLGLPRLRWEGVKRLSRDARLITDRSAAPYVANPYYAAAMAQWHSQVSATRDAARIDQFRPRDAEQDKDAETTRDAVPKPCEGPVDRGATPAEIEQRLQCLESALQQQMEALQQCIEELRSQRSRMVCPPRAPVLVPTPAPCDPRKGAQVDQLGPGDGLTVSPMDRSTFDVRQTSFHVLMPVENGAASDPPRRLPPISPR
jgi:hypothetical protein